MFNVWIVKNDLGDESLIAEGIDQVDVDRIVEEFKELGEEVRVEEVWWPPSPRDV